MIEQHQVLAVLIEACPSFEAALGEHVREHGEELQYVVAGEFARHLLHLYEKQELSCLSAVGVAIERLHVEGSPWVREFATVGVLEGVQNVWSHSGVSPEEFCGFLGPESQRWWRGLKEFWSGQTPVVRADG